MAKYGTAPGELTDPDFLTAVPVEPFVECCGNCYHWQMTAAVTDRATCRRFPPVALPGGQGSPVTKADFRCGEWAGVTYAAA